MRESFREEEVKSLWREILTDKGLEISRLNDPDSKERTVSIKYEEIDELNRDFALNFLKSPEEYIRWLKEELTNNFLSEDFKARHDNRINISISSSLPDIKKNIRELRSADLNTFIQIDGIVKRVSEVVPTITLAAFRCGYCKSVELYPQHGNKLLEPATCNHCNRGKDQTKFQFIPEKSIYMDTQNIEVQEKPELLKGASQPAKISVHLNDELCGKFNPGDRVAVSGILKGRQKFVGNAPTTQFDIYLEALSVERESSEYEEVQISDEDVETIRSLSRDPEIYSKLVKSMAPTIFGMDLIKEAVILQLFGGVRKVFEDNTYIRGEIHILLFGDPGTAKSQILKYSVNLAPKSIYTSGKGSSAAGLTAAAVKDDFSEGRWTLEAGTLVLADGGLAAVDELDKMSREDSGAMHEAMEQQTVTIAKAGINATLMSRCAILGAANPKYGRYEEQETFRNQTDFPPSLLSRFDLIFVIVDRPGKIDSDMANYILKVHSDGEKIASGQGIEKSEFRPYIDQETMKKYIVYARKFCYPILSPAAKERIRNFYIQKREAGIKSSSVTITPRQLEALIRLSEASARIRLSDRVSEEDVARAERLMESFLNETTVVNGQPDVDSLISGISTRERKTIFSLRKIISELQGGEEKEAAYEDIVARGKEAGLDESEIDKQISTLHQRGEIIEVKSGRYRLMRSTG
jgi:replicative DNA helicase Mcm